MTNKTDYSVDKINEILKKNGLKLCGNPIRDAHIEGKEGLVFYRRIDTEKEQPLLLRSFYESDFEFDKNNSEYVANPIDFVQKLASNRILYLATKIGLIIIK